MFLFNFWGRLFSVLWQSIRQGIRPPYYPKMGLQAVTEACLEGALLIALATFFSGMVMALEMHKGFVTFHIEDSIPGLIAISLLREICPIMAGIMLSGRWGASLAAELGSMRVSEQLDSLITLQTHPLKYLVFPRLVAGCLCVPLLTLMGDIIGLVGSFIILKILMNIDPSTYVALVFQMLEPWDVISGLIKASFFGLIVAWTGCSMGYYANGGAKAVGRSAHQAVVCGSVGILLINFILTWMFH